MSTTTPRKAARSLVRTPVPSASPTKRSRRGGDEDNSAAAASLNIVTPAKHDESPTTKGKKQKNTLARRKLPFHAPKIAVQDEVKQIYQIVRKLTGAIGGNGSFGAIYGELTMGSMQKMINLMKEHTDFNSESMFMDVGSGIGKPSLHVMQDPGVAFSYGIEMERSRWLLGMNSLKSVLDAVRNSGTGNNYMCMMDHGNIKKAKTFDPFTHIYMFSIGFPPSLWEYLSDMFNRSASEYLVCFHSPRIIVERYGFEVKLLTQTPTSMHGSSEGHTGYFYQRIESVAPAEQPVCDPIYKEAFDLVQSGLEPLFEKVSARVQESVYGGRVTRAKKVVHCVLSDSEEDDGAQS